MSARVHGGVDPRALLALGLDPREVVDFSVNLNPYGPCAPLLAAVRAAPLDRYPDPAARGAREAWAAALDRRPDEIAVGHGAAALFWAIARAFVAPGARVVIAEPTFSELRVAAAAMGAVLVRPRAPDLALDLDALVAPAQRACMVYLCSPNNPTGARLAPADLAAFAARVPARVVLDQSFVALSDHADDSRARFPDNVIVVRSLTKELACPGLRIGLCVAAPGDIARIEAARPTWATSAPALAALEVAATQAPFVAASWRRLRDDREAVAALLRARGFAPRPSATSYQLVPVRGEARALCAALLRRGVMLRDCASFGLPSHVRVAALPAAARARLAAALDGVRDPR